MGKEDHCLSTTADRSLTAEDDQQLVSAYEQFETADLGADANSKYIAIANQLADRYGVPQGYEYAINPRCDWILITSMRQTRLYC